MSSEGRYCSFFLGDLLFGIEVERVQEVIRPQQMTPVPLASAVVRGLINIRGQIVAAIDLAHRLELDTQASDQSMNVVITRGKRTVSLLVDRIGEVLECDQADFEPPPDTLERSVRDLIRGAFKLEKRLLLLLDTDRVMAFSATGEDGAA